MRSSAVLAVARGAITLAAAIGIAACCCACSSLNTLSTQRAIAQRCENACEENWGPGDGLVDCAACQKMQQQQQQSGPS